MRAGEPPGGLVGLVSRALPPCGRGGLVPQGDRSPPAVGRWPAAEHGASRVTTAMTGGSPVGRQPWTTSRTSPTTSWRRSAVQNPPTTAGSRSMPSCQVPSMACRGRRWATGKAGASSRRARCPRLRARRAAIPPDRGSTSTSPGAWDRRWPPGRRGPGCRRPPWVGGVLDQPAPVQPADGRPAGRHRTAVDADLEGAAGPAHQVAPPRTTTARPGPR
jgi:hypothetical protein